MNQNPTRTRKPTIYLTSKTSRQISLYTKMAQGEISWMGKVIRRGEFDFFVDEIFLIKQETTPTKTKFDDDAMAMFLFKYHQAGNDVGDLKLWLHTHHNFAVGWSLQDEDTINEFNRAEYLISIVTNKFDDFMARIDIFRPLRLTVDAQIVILPNFTAEEIHKAKQEIDEKVSYSEDVRPNIDALEPKQENDDNT